MSAKCEYVLLVCMRGCYVSGQGGPVLLYIAVRYPATNTHFVSVYCMYACTYVCILQAAEVASQQAPSCEPLMRTAVPDLTTAGRLQHSTKRLQNISVLKCSSASAAAHRAGQSVLSCQCQAMVVTVVGCLLPNRLLDRLGSMDLLYHAWLAAGRQFAVHVRLYLWSVLDGLRPSLVRPAAIEKSNIHTCINGGYTSTLLAQIHAM